MKRNSIEDMIELARQKGGKCMSKEYTNNSTKLIWQCAEGHVWEATPFSVKHQSSWCPECVRSGRRLGIKEMQEMAAFFAGQCLSTKYEGLNKDLSWKCDKGHVFESPPRVVRFQGKWCPVCRKDMFSKADDPGPKKRGRKPKFVYSIQDMQELAKRFGGHCISKEYTEENNDLVWVCGVGHSWLSPPKAVRKGRWCPMCKQWRKKRVF